MNRLHQKPLWIVVSAVLLFFLIIPISSAQIPPTPTGISYTIGSSWINQTWSAGTGNTTNSYNVSQNGTWTNGSANLFKNSSISKGGWSNITVWAYNSTGTGNLSATSVSLNTRSPNLTLLTSNGTISYVISKWNNSDDYFKTFNVTGTNTTATWNMTFCDVEASTYQNLNGNGTLFNISMANSTGCIYYSYADGGTSNLQIRVLPSEENPVGYAVAIGGAVTIALLYLGRTRRTQIAKYLSRRKGGGNL
jgi:hypothetical protein